MSKSNPKTAWARRECVVATAACVLLGAVLATSHAVGGALAKYTAAGASSDEARVALFGHNESITIAGLPAKPGDQATTTLAVSNKSANGQVSEVAQEYQIEVETAGNLPLEFTLTDSAGTPYQPVQDIKAAGTTTFNTITYAGASDDGWSFSPGTAETHTYTLTVTWPADEKKPDYANIPDFVQVNINVSQID